MANKNEFVQKGKILVHQSGKYELRRRFTKQGDKSTERSIEYRLLGITKWVSSGTKNLEDASKIAERELLRFGTPCSSIKFKDFAKDFFSRTDKDSYVHYKKSFGYEYSAKCLSNYSSIVNSRLIPSWGEFDIDKITTNAIERWYISLTTEDGDQCSSGYRMKILNVLSIILNFAVKLNVIQVNPCVSVQRMRVESKKKNIFTKDDIKKLFPNDLEEIKTLYKVRGYNPIMFALYFSIMIDTGFRPSEVAGLCINDIREDGGVYTDKSLDSMTRTIKHSIKTTGKGQTYKVGFLSSYTMNLLSEYKKTFNGIMLFKATDGLGLDITCLNLVFKKIVKRAGIEGDFSQYCLRHTFDTNMLNRVGSSLSEMDVRELMAHTSYRKEYDHRTPDDILNRLSAVGDIVDSIRK